LRATPQDLRHQMRALAYQRQTFPNLTVRDRLEALSPLPEPLRTTTFGRLCNALGTGDQPAAELLLDTLLGVQRHRPGDLVTMAAHLGCPSCGATQLVFQHPDPATSSDAGVYRCNAVHVYGALSFSRDYAAVSP
jgi:hypothetical protein